jgi:uncharacterized membrane protein YvbJ
MATIERICTNCGKANANDQVQCVGCGMNMITLSKPEGISKLPAPMRNARTLGIVLGASALVARVGLGLIAQELVPRLGRSIANRQSSRADQATSHDDPDYVVHGWRAWSVHHGAEHSSGSEQFEWRIKRTR